MAEACGLRRLRGCGGDLDRRLLVGWVTGGSAREMAADQARLEVVAALVPVCVEQSRQDPNVTATLASLKGEAATYKRGEMLMKAGWATMPGSTDPDENVAKACMDKLAEQF